ncbi:COX15/CtaA family protein [Thermoleophilum album]|uniref:Cytochrome c oxidase assembly protein subunit 15 n=1 Tax=Thermoleophilum album TaxID=29539 RepID=A0A1H6FTW7_THEAL|nr:COX15/CtaA family protein [Thermoleophilum album]SEH13822.1 cytochrome c oxidase assembly protein subunit 15 [Thermoleophilum album]
MNAAGFRRLAVATWVATFVLIVLGGIVRVSGSGLGCGPEGSGFHGWPFCNGDLVPGLDLNAVIEYAHRVAAGLVGLMILSLFLLAQSRRVEARGLRPLTAGLLVLVVAQAGLGGLTVEEGLDERLVAAHLGLAMLLLGGLLLLVRMSASARSTSADHRRSSKGVRWLAWATAVIVLATIVAGGYMAGTQNYGRPDYRLGDGAHHACGKEFPTCNGDFMPFGQSRLVDIHLTHRAFMYLAVLLTIALVVAAQRRRATAPLVARRARILGLLVVLQVLLGALNVWLDEYELLIVAHLALGTLVWAAALDTALASSLVRATVAEPTAAQPAVRPAAARAS